MYYLVKYSCLNELRHSIVEHSNLPIVLRYIHAIEFRKLISIEVLEGFIDEKEILNAMHSVEDNLEFGGKK
jgi:hypothetical protein